MFFCKCFYLLKKTGIQENATKVKTWQNKMGIKHRYRFRECLWKDKAYKLKAVLKEKEEIPSSY